MRIPISCGLLVSLFTIAACQSNKSADLPTNNSSARNTTAVTKDCGSDAKSVKEVKDQTGIVYYNQGEGQYTIVVTIPNTIDAQDVGIVCNLPTNLQVDGLRVTFDGQYKPYDKTPKAMLGGQSFYYLVVSKLHSEKGNI